jgi:urease accessory protein
VFERLGEHTVLVESRSELPLAIPRSHLRPDGSNVVTLLAPGGGFFAGDTVQLAVECRAGTDVMLRQVGATLLHGREGQGIIYEADVWVAEGARFRYGPNTLIPFAVADYRQRIRVRLEVGAEAILGEVITPGRLDAPFAYRCLDLRTEVDLDGSLIVLDALRIEPACTDYQRALGGFSHVAGLLSLGPDYSRGDADVLHTRLAQSGVCGSASLLPAYGIGARLLGNRADELLRALSPAFETPRPAVNP